MTNKPSISGQDDDITSIAAQDFLPWDLETTHKAIPAGACDQFVHIRVAAQTLGKTKPEIIELAKNFYEHKTDDGNLFQDTIERFQQTRDWLKVLERVLDTAECRLMVGLANYADLGGEEQ